MGNKELAGNTRIVYAYVVREDRPVGTRDVMRGANLSSPSVAHRHLQKLELLGLRKTKAATTYSKKKQVSVGTCGWAKTLCLV